MEYNYQMNAQMGAQMMMQNPIMPNPMMQNPMINMNEQNNFFNHDLTNKMGNLFIANQGYNNNGNMAMEQNKIENKNFFFVSFISRTQGDGGSIWIETFKDEKISELIEKYRKKSCDYVLTKKFIFNAKYLNTGLTCAEAGLVNGACIFIVTVGVKGGGAWYNKEINIKFIKVTKDYHNTNDNKEIIGLLKLCFLKEISQKISEDKLKSLPDMVFYILKILSNGYIENEPDAKNNIAEVLKKSEGSNIITFSNYVEEIIDSKLINKLLSLLDKKDLKEMVGLKNILSNYNNCIGFFKKEFIRALKESIFEFSIISLAIIEREDFEKFEKERVKCPNRVEKILFSLV